MAKTRICCCNVEPPTLRCAACTHGNHEGCFDPSVPARPQPQRLNPGISERRPRASHEESGIGWRWLWILVVLIVGLAFYGLSRVTWGSEDEREIRKFGHLECVYNVDTDTIEDCVEVQG